MKNYWKVDFQIDILEEACETASHIVNCHRTAYIMHAHAHVMAFMRFPNMAFPNSDIWRVRIRIYIYFFFFPARVADEFSEVARASATRVFYTGEIFGYMYV